MIIQFPQLFHLHLSLDLNRPILSPNEHVRWGLLGVCNDRKSKQERHHHRQYQIGQHRIAPIWKGACHRGQRAHTNPVIEILQSLNAKMWSHSGESRLKRKLGFDEGRRGYLHTHVHQPPHVAPGAAPLLPDQPLMIRESMYDSRL